MGWRLTIRHGSRVEKQRFDSLDDALDAARDHVSATLREGRLGSLSALRDFTPGQRVQCRVEVSAKSLLRGPEAGIDVMGDGNLIAYRGAIRKQPLDTDTLDEAVERLREVLSA